MALASFGKCFYDCVLKTTDAIARRRCRDALPVRCPVPRTRHKCPVAFPSILHLRYDFRPLDTFPHLTRIHQLGCSLDSSVTACQPSYSIPGTWPTSSSKPPCGRHQQRPHSLATQRSTHRAEFCLRWARPVPYTPRSPSRRLPFRTPKSSRSSCLSASRLRRVWVRWCWRISWACFVVGSESVACFANVGRSLTCRMIDCLIIMRTLEGQRLARCTMHTGTKFGRL